MSIKFNQARWHEIEKILDAALALPQEQRLDFVRQRCAEDHPLCAEIEALLLSGEHTLTYLEQPVAQFASPLFTGDKTTSRPSSHPATGSKIGAYSLCEELGRGGMGIVYRGERQQPEFEHQVAIKILTGVEQHDLKNSIKLGRFQQEQQTLAALNHPNIAQLFDAGFSTDNHAYIVMEYVDGLAIDQYCSTHELSIPARLNLILQVAQALSFAHQNLIVHRDIKPSNILVNTAGQVKLLDFGIAKLLTENIDVAVTKTSEFLMTPGAAAPEQIMKQPITVATDIYQLGLVLYELLTEHKAFSDQADSLYALAKVICEKAPTPPSKILNQIATASQNKVNQKAKQIKVQKKLQGDLDAITLKALRTSPPQRYVSMQSFILDIEAHLDGRLVEARQKNITYLVSSFSRRHWRLLLVSCSFVALLITYALTVTLQSQRIQKALQISETETQKALQVSTFLTNIFKTSDPNVSGLEQITAQQLLERGRQDIQHKLQNAPEIRGHMFSVLGDIYYSQGAYQQSSELLQQALVQQRALVQQQPRKLANTLTKLAISLSTLGQYEQAEQLLQESLSIHALQLQKLKQTKPTLENNPIAANYSEAGNIAYAETLNAYAALLKVKGQHDKAETLFLKAIEVMKKVQVDQNELAVARNGLASIQHVQGRFTAAIENMRQVLRIQQQSYGEQHTYYTMTLNNLATMLTDTEQFEEAKVLTNQSLAIQRRMLGDDHPYVGTTLRSLGILAYRQGQFSSAKTFLHQALLNKRLNHPQDNVTIAVILLWLGAVVQDMGDFDDANHHYQSMLGIFRELEVSDGILGRGLCQLASLAYAQNQLTIAQEIYQEALNLLPEEGVRTAIAQLGSARVILAQNSDLSEKHDLSEAQSLAQAALFTRQTKYPKGHSLIAEAQAVLGLIAQQQNNLPLALDLLDQADAVLQHQPMFHHRVSANNLAQQVQKSLEQFK